jgi:hypothetical protein
LAAYERRWAQVIAEALLPVDAVAGPLAGALDDTIDVGARYDEECARSPWHAALLLRGVLWLVWLAPVWLLRRPKSFGALPAGERVALLERILAHRRYPVRMAAMLLKLTICTVLLGDEHTLAQLGAYRLSPPAERVRRSAS